MGKARVVWGWFICQSGACTGQVGHVSASFHSFPSFTTWLGGRDRSEVSGRVFSECSGCCEFSNLLNPSSVSIYSHGYLAAIYTSSTVNCIEPKISRQSNLICTFVELKLDKWNIKLQNLNIRPRYFAGQIRTHDIQISVRR